MNFIDELTNKNNSFKKLLLVICGMSVIILPMNLLTAKALYFFSPGSFHQYFHR